MWGCLQNMQAHNRIRQITRSSIEYLILTYLNKRRSCMFLEDLKPPVLYMKFRYTSSWFL